MNVNKTHHQNSGLAAQPSKTAYLLKQTLIASPNVIDPLAAMVVHSLGYACWNTSTQVV
jgi:2-methylisocitrate lyase-like PEP mutase family enzyme